LLVVERGSWWPAAAGAVCSTLSHLSASSPYTSGGLPSYIEASAGARNGAERNGAERDKQKPTTHGAHSRDNNIKRGESILFLKNKEGKVNLKIVKNGRSHIQSKYEKYIYEADCFYGIFNSCWCFLLATHFIGLFIQKVTNNEAKSLRFCGLNLVYCVTNAIDKNISEKLCLGSVYSLFFCESIWQ